MLDEEAADGVDESGLFGAGEGQDELAAGLRTRGHDFLRCFVLRNAVSDAQHPGSRRAVGSRGGLDRGPPVGLP
ncbi:hypothetical protein GCM10023083_19170 [Streptomyces phyllanthi]